jgi:hypothetical protein
MSDSLANAQLLNQSFSEALYALKNGHKLARSGWNGKGMFIIKAGDYKVTSDKLNNNKNIDKEFLQSQDKDTLDILPHIDMWTAQKTYLVGWVPSQIDMFSDDWEIVE